MVCSSISVHTYNTHAYLWQDVIHSAFHFLPFFPSLYLKFEYPQFLTFVQISSMEVPLYKDSDHMYMNMKCLFIFEQKSKLYVP